MNDNSLGILRFVLAFLVSLVHIYNLSGESTFKILDDYGMANLSVNIFFVLSGFLMPLSYKHSKSLRRFYLKRFFRIYIGYFFVVLVIPVCGFVISDCMIYEYFSLDLFKYYLFNFMTLNFLKPDLLCLFQDQPITAINGSLWSIKIELMFYLLVPVIYGFYQKLKDEIGRTWLTLFFLILGMIVNYFIYFMYLKTQSSFWDSMQNQLPSKLYFFMCGWGLYFYLSKNSNSIWEWMAWSFFLVSVIIYMLKIQVYEFIQLPIACGLITLFYKMKNEKAGVVIKVLGGCSYHIYLLHFPVIQGLISLNKRGLGWDITYSAICIVGVLSYVLYRLETYILVKLNRKIN